MHHFWLWWMPTPSDLQATKKIASFLTAVAEAEAVLAEAAGQVAQVVGAEAAQGRKTKAPILLLPRARMATATAQAVEGAQDVAAVAGTVEILTATMAQAVRALPFMAIQILFHFLIAFSGRRVPLYRVWHTSSPGHAWAH